VPKENTSNAALLCSRMILTDIDKQYVISWLRKFSWYWNTQKWKV